MFIIISIFFVLIYIIRYLFYLYCLSRSFIPTKVDKSQVELLKNDYNEKINIEYIDNNFTKKKNMMVLFKNNNKPSWNDDNIIIFFHGIGGWIRDVLEKEMVIELSKNNTIIIMDYTGYGINVGNPTEEIINNDVINLWNYVTNIKKVPINNISICGHSLGACLSSNLIKTLLDEKRNIPKKLLLISSFYNFYEISKEISPFIGRLNILKFEHNNYLECINGKINITYIHGFKDKMIHFKHSFKLFYETNAKLIICEGDHYDMNLNKIRFISN